LRNVKVVYYPLNYTSVVQPLDLSVIKCSKQVYRKQLVQRAVRLMEAGKGVQLKINILCAIHLIVSVWQQVTQSTIQNQDVSDVMEVDRSGEDDVNVSVDQELTTCGVLYIEEMCGAMGSGSCIEEGQGDGGGDEDEAKSKPAPSFTEALRAFESVRAFMYAHDITKRDQVNIVNIERSLFSLKRKGATKEIRIDDFLKRSNANWT
jgi:hypothetical protein